MFFVAYAENPRSKSAESIEIAVPATRSHVRRKWISTVFRQPAMALTIAPYQAKNRRVDLLSTLISHAG